MRYSFSIHFYNYPDRAITSIANRAIGIRDSAALPNKAEWRLVINDGDNSRYELTLKPTTKVTDIERDFVVSARPQHKTFEAPYIECQIICHDIHHNMLSRLLKTAAELSSRIGTDARCIFKSGHEIVADIPIKFDVDIGDPRKHNYHLLEYKEGSRKLEAAIQECKLLLDDIGGISNEAILMKQAAKRPPKPLGPYVVEEKEDRFLISFPQAGPQKSALLKGAEASLNTTDTSNLDDTFHTVKNGFTVNRGKLSMPKEPICVWTVALESILKEQEKQGPIKT